MAALCVVHAAELYRSESARTDLLGPFAEMNSPGMAMTYPGAQAQAMNASHGGGLHIDAGNFAGAFSSDGPLTGKNSPGMVMTFPGAQAQALRARCGAGLHIDARKLTAPRFKLNQIQNVNAFSGRCDIPAAWPGRADDQPVRRKMVDVKVFSDADLVALDLEHFWKWCPAPPDGLHRCALIVKLFDYCGLTRKSDKVGTLLQRLNNELHDTEDFPARSVNKDERVMKATFVLNMRLRDAVAATAEVHQWCDNARRVKHLDLNMETSSPLRTWVLGILKCCEPDMQ